VVANLAVSGESANRGSVQSTNFVWLYLSIGFLAVEMVSYLASFTSIYMFQSFICKKYFTNEELCAQFLFYLLGS